MNPNGPFDLAEGGIVELHRLLAGLRFSVTRGAFAAGRTVSVTIDPVAHREAQVLLVTISCRALGFRVFEWTGHAVRVTRLNRDGRVVSEIGFLNERGTTILEFPLEPSTSRVALRPIAACAAQVVTQTSVPRPALAAGPSDRERSLSPDGLVVAEVIRTRTSVSIRFEFTNRGAASFRRADVWWAFLGGRRILREGTLKLGNDKPGALQDLQLAEDATLVFDVIPEERGSGDEL